MVRPLWEIYDDFATTYESNRQAFDISPILDQFRSRLQLTTGHLLDLGCGAGEPVARDFIDRSWQVTGVDFSRRMLALAERLVPEMVTCLGDMVTAEFPESRFDAVIAAYSLFHVPVEQHPQLFSSVWRWLKPGGRFLFTYATRAYTGSDTFSGYKAFLGQQLFYSHTTPQLLESELQRCGFAVEALEEWEVGGEVFLWVTVSRPSPV